jgi:hypothetical protein
VVQSHLNGLKLLHPEAFFFAYLLRLDVGSEYLKD